MLNKPENYAVGVPPTRPCGCPLDAHEPFCDIGRYEGTREHKRLEARLAAYRKVVEAARMVTLTEPGVPIKEWLEWKAGDWPAMDDFRRALAELDSGMAG